MTLTPALSATLAEVARAEGRFRELVAIDAVTEHVAANLEMRAKILRGDADIATGRVASHEEAMAELARLIAAADKSKSRH